MTTTDQQRRSPLGLFPDEPVPQLYDRIVEVLRGRQYSHRTEEAYLHWIRRYIEFHEHQHPRLLTEGDVNRFLPHLAVKEHIAASTHKTKLCPPFCSSTSMPWNNRSTASKASFVPIVRSHFRSC